MSYGEAVLERGAGRRYRWKGRPGLSHKPIKNIACLSDSMSHKAPAERGGFASSALSCKVRRRDNHKDCNFLRACFSSCKAAFSCLLLLPPLPHHLFTCCWERQEHGGDAEATSGGWRWQRCSAFLLLFSALLRSLVVLWTL